MEKAVASGAAWSRVGVRGNGAVQANTQVLEAVYVELVLPRIGRGDPEIEKLLVPDRRPDRVPCDEVVRMAREAIPVKDEESAAGRGTVRSLVRFGRLDAVGSLTSPGGLCSRSSLGVIVGAAISTGVARRVLGSLVAVRFVAATLSTVRVVRVTRLFLDSAELPLSLRVWFLLLLLPL